MFMSVASEKKGGRGGAGEGKGVVVFPVGEYDKCSCCYCLLPRSLHPQ